MGIDFEHWTKGGTMITNFSIPELNLFKTAVKEYNVSVNQEILYVSEEAHYPGSFGRVKSMGSLHSLIGHYDLSDFWVIYRRLEQENNL